LKQKYPFPVIEEYLTQLGDNALNKVNINPRIARWILKLKV